MSEKWQHDWFTFLETVAERLRAGDTTEMLSERFGGKSVAWKGTLDDKSIDEQVALVGIGMTERTLDLGKGRAAVVDGVSLPIADDAVGAWNSIKIGSVVRFTAKLGERLHVFPPVEAKHFRSGASVLMVRLSDGRPA